MICLHSSNTWQEKKRKNSFESINILLINLSIIYTKKIWQSTTSLMPFIYHFIRCLLSPLMACSIASLKPKPHLPALIYQLHLQPEPQQGLFDLLEAMHCTGQQFQSLNVFPLLIAVVQGPQYDMMWSVTVLGLHDIPMALPAMTFPPVAGPRFVQSTSC